MAPITIGIKCTDGSSLSIDIDDDLTILDVKNAINVKYSHQVDLIKLVFKGKVLENDSSIKSVNIQNSSVLHMVISRLKEPQFQPQSQPQQSQPVPSSAPRYPTTNNNTPSTSNNPYQPFGYGQQMSQMSEQLRRNPELLRSMMNSPYMDMMFQNPELMTQIMSTNPQFKELYENNPEIAQIINSPTLLNEMKELMKNPDQLNALLRSQDQLLGQLEGVEGGFGAIQRAYHQYQEPLTNAMQNVLAPPALPTSLPSTSVGINNSPPPNPWANVAPGSSTLGSDMSNLNPSLFPYQAMPTFGSNPNIQQQMTYFSEHPEDFRTMMDIMQRAGMLNNVLPSFPGQNLGDSSGQPVPSTSPVIPTIPMPSLEELRTKYQDQLDQIHALGFYDDDKTLRVLHQCSGNVEYAVNRLLES